MNLRKLIFTNNACYKAGKTITPKGIMVHSTGANNPNLKRYVGPDDGLLGKNKYNNHWNTYHPDGREVCPHAFIGKLGDGTIATYQTLPWNHRGWHAGGSANDTHIGIEICEDGLNNSSYFNAVYKEAVNFCVYLCKMYDMIEQDIICHSEGYTKGIANNHRDVMHWFPKHGKSMDTFRADVKKQISNKSSESEKSTIEKISTGSKVEIKSSATRYYPRSSIIPEWVKSDYYHIVTQTTYNDKPVIKGKKTCVLLGKKIKKSGGDIIAGINTWVASDNLNLVDFEKSTAYRVHTVMKGDSLWAIAEKYLGSGAMYPEIVKLNSLNSNTIFPGQKLDIPN